MTSRAVACRALGPALLALLLSACDGGTGSAVGSDDGNTPPADGGTNAAPVIALGLASVGLPGISAASPVLVSSQRVGRTLFDYTYTVQATNNGAVALGNVSASVTSEAATTVVTDDVLSFGNLGAGASAPSTDSFTIRQDRSAPLSAASLTITFSGTPLSGPAEGVLLGGQPGDPALSRTLDMPPIPAQAADIAGGIILTRLDISVRSDATVGQVNSALAEVGGGIVAMLAGSTDFVVGVPRQPDFTSLKALAAALQAQPGILIAVVGRSADLDVAPPSGSQALDARIFSHLQASRFPAAWNARAAIGPCNSNRITLVVADSFGDGSDPGYDDFSTEVRDVVALNQGTVAPVGEGTHGYDVLAIAAADLDAFIPTGANPFPECVDLRAINLFGYSDRSRIAELGLSLPAGKVVLNTSWGFAKCLDPATLDCTLEQARQIPTAYERAYAGAAQRQLLQSRAADVLVTSTAGNNGNKDVRFIYSGAAKAEYNSAMNVAARSDSTLSWITDRDLWDDQLCSVGCYPSLAATPEERASLTAWLAQTGQAAAPPAPNVLIVGGMDRAGTVLQLSSPTGDVFAVGDDVPMVDGSVDSGSSFAAPQVAGLAIYLWQLSPELRERPVADTIAAIKANATAGTVPSVDAYATVLSIDGGQPLTPEGARIRLALLNANDGNQSFDEADLAQFLAAFLPGGVRVEPASRDDSRHDLNGDGFTGGSRTAAFDLDPGDSARFGLRNLSEVSSDVLGTVTTFDESAVTDMQILCYYAYSPLFTGNPSQRDDLLRNRCFTLGISPAAAWVEPGGSIAFTAAVNGTTTQDVTWSVPDGGGTISGAGLFTAGFVNATFTVRATSTVNPDVAAIATVRVGIPRSWVGTISINESSSKLNQVVTPPRDTPVDGQISLGSTYTFSSESSLSVTVPVEIDLQEALGTTENFTVGTVTGTGSLAYAEVRQGEFKYVGHDACVLAYENGTWINLTGATSASADGFSLRLGNDGSYTLFFGTASVEGPATRRDVSIYADSPSNETDCYAEVGNIDGTEVITGGVGGGGEPPEASGSITNGEIAGTVMSTVDVGERDGDGSTGESITTVTWFLRPR